MTPPQGAADAHFSEAALMRDVEHLTALGWKRNGSPAAREASRRSFCNPGTVTLARDLKSPEA